jgi:2-hydroxychromene-2-carboxylate isomerase
MLALRRLRRLGSVAALLAASVWLGALPSPTRAAPASPAPDKAAAPSGDKDELPPGIDLAGFSDFDRKVFVRIVNREASACGKGHSLLHSAKHDPSCRASFYALRYVVYLIKSGFMDSEIVERLDKRFRAPRVPRFDLANAPSKGPAAARITVVEYVDYECPHCKHAQTLMRQLIEDYPNDVKVYFKHFPLSGHTNARLAAEAAVAAHKQGKFWAFSDKVWAQSDELTPAGLEKTAKEVGLDVARWRKDAASDACKNIVQADRDEGSDQGITGTPTIYINGRKYVDSLVLAPLKDWIDEELGR